MIFLQKNLICPSVEKNDNTINVCFRKLHEMGTSEKIGSVNEKLQIATSTLQQAIGGISQSLSSNNDKVCTLQTTASYWRNITVFVLK